jgi:hypothetical protein
MKSLSLDDYKEAGEEFWPKYHYIREQIGDVEPSQIIKVMEALSGIAMKQKSESKLSFGFNKKVEE